MNWSLDPELVPIAAMMPHLDVRDPASARRLMSEMAAQVPAYVLPETVTVEERSVLGRRQGDPPVPIVVVTPVQPAQSSRPAVLWAHGGGFVLGFTVGDLPTAVSLAEGTGAVVVLVDYRLAPEFPFPAALDDCHAVLSWMRDNASDLGIDPNRLAVGGISAGGALAAALTLECRDQGGPPISFQLLDIPVLDDRLQTLSVQSFIDTPVWNRSNAEASWKHYLGFESGAVSAYAAPARAVDLSGLPPAYVTACEFDPLRDEAIEYGYRLVQAGVSVELHVFPGTFHGSADLGPGAAVSGRMLAERVSVLKHAFERSPDTASTV